MTDIRQGPHERRFWGPVLLASLVVVGAFVAALLAWTHRAPRGYVSTGLFQGDMPTYLCYARMAARSPTLFSYANAYDLRDPPWPVYVNLPISAMGAMLRVMPPAWVENLLRAAFGVGMYLSLAALLSRLFGRGRWFWAAFATAGVGAGVTWAAALLTAPSLGRFAERARTLEEGHYWWALSLFRNLSYPLELVYHVILFAQLIALMDGRIRRANGLFLLGALCNPFLGIQMMGAQLAVALAAPEPTRAQRTVSFAIAAGFLGYYGLLLPLDPIAASFHRQHHGAFGESLDLADLVLGHGPAVLGLIAPLSPPFRRWLLAQRYGLPLLAFTLWTLLLTQNGRFLQRAALQPMHFTRGYLATGLVCLSLLWLRERAARARHLGLILTLFALIALPDNARFLWERWRAPPAVPLMMQPADARAVVDALARTPGSRRVLTLDSALSRNICALTEHRVLFGTEYTTPDYDARLRAARAFRENSARERDVGGAAIDAVVVPAEDRAWRDALSSNPAWRRGYTNASYTLFYRHP